MNITLDPKQFRIEKTTRGAPCLIFENYKFRYGNKMKDEIRWRCTNKLCKATIKTNEKGITEKRTVHDHEPVCERRNTKKYTKNIGRIKLKCTSFFRPAGSHFVDCKGEPLLCTVSIDTCNCKVWAMSYSFPLSQFLSHHSSFIIIQCDT